MATFQKRLLSTSTNGSAVAVGTSATTVHTANATNDEVTLDLITIYAYNDDTAARVLTLTWGDNDAFPNKCVQTIPSQSGLSLVLSDHPLNNGDLLKASTTVTSAISLTGYVNRIS